jgi:hemerythrin
MPQSNQRPNSTKNNARDTNEPFITWGLAIYSVGIKEIDRQHSILAELINRLDAGVKNKISKETMEDIMNSLADYTVFHFGYEEKLLADNHWPQLESHKAIHAAFVNKVQLFQAQLKTKDIHEVAEDILVFLKDWLLDHILKTDKQYGAILNTRGVH